VNWKKKGKKKKVCENHVHDEKRPEFGSRRKFDWPTKGDNKDKEIAQEGNTRLIVEKAGKCGHDPLFFKIKNTPKLSRKVCGLSRRGARPSMARAAIEH